MRYKVGDKVRVRGDLETGKFYGDIRYNAVTQGNILAIEVVTSSGGNVCDDGMLYADEMLRPAEFKIWCETEEELKTVLDEINNEKYFEKHEAEYWHIAPVGIIVEEIKKRASMRS